MNYMNKNGTAHNRTVYASPPVGGSGFRVARSFRYAPFPRHTSPTFLQARQRKPTVSFVGLAKMSYTAGTLCAIAHKIG
jgi:hypothetical protein